ncbi:MAG: hypothetical protein AABY64_07765 [Bdellovibrionota bacterium]
MRMLILVGFVLSISMPSLAVDEANILLLRLENKIDDRVVSSVDFFANDVDSGSSSVDDKYILKINGKITNAPVTLLMELDHSRGDYDDNQRTGGIKEFVSGGFCRMGGPSGGSILSVNYFTDRTYGQKQEMRAVYSENGNCLFREGFKPVNAEAEKSAAKTMAILQTILAFSQE